MADNLTLHMAPNHGQLVAEMSPVVIDISGKVIRRSGLSNIHIQNSVLLGMVVKKDKTFSMIRSNLVPVLGQKINLSFKLSKTDMRMIGNIKVSDVNYFVRSASIILAGFLISINAF